MKKTFTYTGTVLFLLTALQVSVFARAGGGSGGGGFSGGGGLFRRHYHRLFDNLTSANGSAFFLAIVQLIIELAVVVFMIASTVVLIIKLKRSKHQSKLLLSKLGKNDPIWNPKTLNKHIYKSFYAIQKAWSDDNIYSVRNLLSDKLYAEFCQKLDRSRRDGTKNVLSEIKLIKAYPISVQDRIGEENDCIWYYIEASMIDQTVDISTNRVLSGMKTPQSFVEYWRFCKKDNSWVLDSISQQREFENMILDSQRPY